VFGLVVRGKMGFKKSAQKNKKKSKKKSSSDREWSHEGGQKFETKADTGDDENKKKHVRRRTQDRDERQRRGRSKIEIRKQKQAFVKKMSKKISFKDILGLDEEVEEKREEPSKKRSFEANPMKSTSQVYKKIKRFFVDSTPEATESGSERGDDIEEEEDEDDDEEIQDFEDDQNSEIERIETKVGIVLQDVGEADSQSDGATPPAGIADWFFSSKDEDNTSLDKTSTIKVNDLELSPTLTASISAKMNPKVSPFAITRLGDVPQLHSMWAHLYGNHFASPIEATLLSYLSCYTDLFIEGRDEHNDKEILYGTLWHILGHVINSRCVPLLSPYLSTCLLLTVP
jgi:hypothetical protein